MCVRFNKDWLPYVLGGLFQLVNPSSWLVDGEPSLLEALNRATALLDIFGKAGDCPPMDLRFTATCLLQSSVDGGATWVTVPGWDTNFPICNPPQTQVKFDADCLLTESFDGGETFEAVPGWAANFKDCVVSNAPIIGLPPNPGDQLPDQFACSIAAYLADQVILLAMQKAVNAVQDDLTLLVFGGEVLTIIPEFVLVAAAYDAFATIYGFVAEGTLSHYEAAIADEALWQAVTCSIYSAIRSDGYVTPGNFGQILTNINAISYTYSDVVTAIAGYVSSLGATGLAQLSQRAGLLVGSDCSICGGWRCVWDFTIDAQGWTADTFGGIPNAVYTAGVGWTQVHPPTGGTKVQMRTVGANTALISGMNVFYNTNTTRGGADRLFFVEIAGTVISGSGEFDGSGSQSSFWAPGVTGDTIVVALNSNVGDGTIVVTKVIADGQGTCPWPAYNVGF